MKKKKRWMNVGTYQKKIYIWISIFFVFAQITFSSAILYKTNQQEIQSNYEMNEKIFRQVAYNIEQSDEVIRGICKSLFVNPKIVKMMYSIPDERALDEWIQEYQSVYTPILLGNPQLQSIYIYNGEMDQLFSSYHYLSYQDEGIRKMLDSGELLPLFTPFVRTIQNISNPSKTSKVITYVLYDTLNEAGRPDGAVIVNVDLNKFNDEIRQLLTFSDEEKSEIFIFSQKEIILDWKEGEKNKEIEKEIKKMTEEIQIPYKKNFALETRKISGEKYGIFFTDISGVDWVVVKVQSYNEVFSNINRLIMMIITVSAVFCAIMLMSIFFLSRKIYGPIGKLVHKVKEAEDKEDSDINEIQYLNQVYEGLFRKAREYQRKFSQSKIILAYNLQNLLMEGTKTDPAVWNALHTMNPVIFQKDNYFCVIMLKIDDYQKLEREYGHDERKLYKFAIENIFSELLENEGYHSVIVPIEADKMVALIQGNAIEEKEYHNSMEACFRIVNENLKKFYQISITGSVSSYCKGIEKIHDAYDVAENNLVYRYALGKASLVFYDYCVEQADGREIDTIMKLLSTHIEEGDFDNIRLDFERITELVKRQDSDHIMDFITRQVVNILDLMGAKEKSQNASRGSAILERYTEILSLETWEEMSEYFLKKLIHVSKTEEKQCQRTNLLVSTIQKIIHEEFEDPNLCLQQISEMIKMSSQYVGRIFKGTVGISVAEYINEYRLKKSIEIMMSTGCTISDVLEKVGIENESQYYRLFKKKYGTTPKAYMLELLTAEKIEE